MTGILLRQDPALRTLLRLVLPQAAVITLLIRAWPSGRQGLAELAASQPPQGTMPMVLLYTLLALFWVASCGPWSRCGRLHLGLPIATRRLWLVRMAALLIAAVLPLLLVWIILALRVDLDTGVIAVAAGLFWPAARITASMVLAVVLLQTPSSTRHRIAVSAEYVALCAGTCLAAVVLTLVGFPSPLGTLAILAAALVLGVLSYRALPQVFSLAEHEQRPRTDWEATTGPAERAVETLGSGPTGPTPSMIDGHGEGRWLLQQTIFRTLMNNPGGWTLLLCVLSYAAVCVGEFSRGGNHILPMLLVSIWAVPVLQLALARTDSLDPLPISRRLVLAHIALPVAAALAAGLVAAVLSLIVAPRPPALIQVSNHSVQVPLEYWRISPDATPPAVVAPWGESHTPEARSLVRGSSVAVYNPFETDRTSSPRFVAWQLRRAIAEVHGEAAPELKPDELFIAAVQRGAFTPDCARGLGTRGRGRTAAVELLLLVVGATVVVVTYLQQFSAALHRRVFRWLSVAVVVVVAATAAGMLAAETLDITRVWTLAVLLSIGVHRLAAWAPLSTTALWALVLVAGVGAYLLVQGRFERIELPGRRILSSLGEES